MSYLYGKKIQEDPYLLFDRSDSSARQQQVYWGLRNFGPFTKDKQEIKIDLLSPASEQKRLQELVNTLNAGTSTVPGGMPRFFGCKLTIRRMHTTDSYSVNDYETAASNIINSTDCKDVDVILAKIPRTSQYFSNTPYYRLKAMFTSKGFASQMITDATFNNLNWSYLNLGIALFSKAGGTPWVLASEMKKVDMVLGISVSNVITYKNRAGGYPRYVGCSNVFDSYGKWMFFDGTAEPFEEDKRTRNKQLKQLVNQAIAKFNALKNKPPKNIVIHYFKRFGQREIQSIKDALHESIGDDFNLACISINSTHPYRMYDKSTKDGSFPRGSYVYLNDKECLLSTTGETPIAGRRLGTPKLLQIRMDENTNSFMNMDEIVYQIFALTKLNWATSMSMNREPVTLAFSNAIAYLTAAMSESEWKGVTSVCPTLNGRPWFL